MNLDPQQNKVGDIEPDSPKEITPGNLPQQTPEDGDFECIRIYRNRCRSPKPDAVCPQI